jgi:hypothetical protein
VPAIAAVSAIAAMPAIAAVAAVRPSNGRQSCTESGRDHAGCKPAANASQNLTPCCLHSVLTACRRIHYCTYVSAIKLTIR